MWFTAKMSGVLEIHLSYNILLPRQADSLLPSPFPRVCTVSVWLYADVITFSQMDRLPNFLNYGALLARFAGMELHY